MKVNILFLSAGRRVALINAFRKAFNSLKNVEGKIISIDATSTATALYISDKYYVVPLLNSEKFIPKLLNICKKEKINAIIPTIDLDLPILAKNKDKIEKTGAKVIISNSEAIDTCINKYKTHQFLFKNNIPTMKTFFPSQLKDFSPLDYPLFIKPIKGYASIETFKIHNEKELSFFVDYLSNDILIQEFVDGKEYTIDVLSDFKGKVLSVVPRERIEIRAGEVTRGRTEKNKDMINYTVQIAEKLKLIGPSTIQCIVDKTGPHFFEINPRFGGGVPLSIKAGANSPLYLIKMILGEKIKPFIGKFEENLYMLRYDEAIFIKKLIKKTSAWREK